MPRINMVFDLDLFLPDNIASVFSYVLWPCNFRGPSRRKQGQTFTLTMPTAASVANVIVSARTPRQYLSVRVRTFYDSQ